jgi:GTPase Era involved in 16S rRNA processing
MDPGENSLDKLAALADSSPETGKSAERMEAHLKGILEKYQDAAYTPKLQGMMDSLEKAKNEFLAKKFFVLVMGPAKSGKSTLVNIFARQYVSPTAAGECTALPAIIGKADGGHLDKIIRYVPFSHLNGEEEKEAFETLVDAIRGIKKADEVYDFLRKASSGEITDDNIRKAIQIDLENPEHALAVTIGIPEGDFIKDNILLIDMPGLDGSTVNTESDPILEAMANKADMVIFVQSALSTLSKQSVDFLAKMFSKIRKRPPFRLILNVHDSQYFLEDDPIKKSDREEPIKRIQQQISDYSKEAPYELNLGMIYAHYLTPGRIKDDPQIKSLIEGEVDKYESVKTKLIDTLDTERQRIREQNNLNYAGDILEEAEKTLENEIKAFTKDARQIQEKKRRLESLAAELESARAAANEDTLSGHYQTLLKTVQKSWEERIRGIVDGSKKTIKPKITGSEWNNKLRDAATKCGNDFPFKAESQLRAELDGKTQSLVLGVYEDAVDAIAAEILEITGGTSCAALDRSSRREYVRGLITNMKRDVSPFEIVAQEEETGLRPIKAIKELFKKYSRDDFNRSIDTLAASGGIAKKLEEYGETLRSEFRRITGEYAQYLKRSIDQHNKTYVVEQQAEMEKLDAWIARLKEMRNEIEK